MMFAHSESHDARELLAQPDWAAAAQALVDACAASRASARPDRPQVLERFADILGQKLYPALLGVLCVVSERASADAKSAVAGCLSDALSSGRMPCARWSAWGSRQRFSVTGTTRSLGPVEYLCTTYAESGVQSALPEVSFDHALQALLRLFSETNEIRALYCERLLALGEDPLDEGAIRVQTINSLHQLAHQWKTCANDFHLPVQVFKSSYSPESLRHLASGYHDRPSQSPTAWSY
jgi:hypothetical protein